MTAIIVSSRAPVWGASYEASRREGNRKCFKSCPRVGGIGIIDARGEVRVVVSSRAPVWGASLTGVSLSDTTLVSSRAPVWGASFYNAKAVEVSTPFQVVPPCGGHRSSASLA